MTHSSVEGERRIQVNDLTFRVIDRGSGPVVLMIHGWPDSSYLWRHQIPVLVSAGFRVIAPDLRGFGHSDRPEGVEAYRISALLSDVQGMLAALNVTRMSVVGHDWGATISWRLAAQFPQQVERLAVLSVGHPGTSAYDRLLQWQKRWYMLWFQFPGVAEEALPRNNWSLFREFLQGQGDEEHSIADLSRPGALTASLNLYRANISPTIVGAEGPSRLPAVTCPTLGLWGSEDLALLENQMLHSSEYVKGPWHYERLEGVGHWLPTAAPDKVNALLLAFLKDEGA